MAADQLGGEWYVVYEYVSFFGEGPELDELLRLY